jgi:hypothetical protein
MHQTHQSTPYHSRMAYGLGYLSGTPTSNICCLFMTLLISTDEELKQRGYPGPCFRQFLSIDIDCYHIVPPTTTIEQRDREQARTDVSIFDRFPFNFRRPGEPPPQEIDLDMESDFEAPTPRNMSSPNQGKWYRRTKKPDLLKPDDERLRTYACPPHDFTFTYTKLTLIIGNAATCCM